MAASSREIKIAGFTMACMLMAFAIDAHCSLALQRLLGVAAWCCLLWLQRYVDDGSRLQVACAVVFATAGELVAAVVLEAYQYRFDNVPAYVPPGHGMVNLSAMVLARCELFTRYRRSITAVALALGVLWTAPAGRRWCTSRLFSSRPIWSCSAPICKSGPGQSSSQSPDLLRQTRRAGWRSGTASSTRWRCLALHG
jgi:hypothetical protein